MIDILDKIWESRHPEDALFLNIVKGCEVKYNNGVYECIRDSNLIFRYRESDNHIYIYRPIYIIFQNKFIYKHRVIYNLIYELVKYHLKIIPEYKTLTSGELFDKNNFIM